MLAEHHSGFGMPLESVSIARECYQTSLVLCSTDSSQALRCWNWRYEGALCGADCHFHCFSCRPSDSIQGKQRKGTGD